MLSQDRMETAARGRAELILPAVAMGTVMAQAGSPVRAVLSRTASARLDSSCLHQP